MGTPGATPGAPMGRTAAATMGFCPVMGICAMMPPCSDPAGATVVMSWMDARRLSFLFCELRRMKYFCAWEATCRRKGQADVGGRRVGEGLGSGQEIGLGVRAEERRGSSGAAALLLCQS